ncbi:DUF4376 domain-containing protein [Pseudomonas nitroreducens]|uniref:DUF4376 domain-containing protein n=1 Tax=Pseudomonas nitroreducens TaxID=46680 RepID=UPI00147F0A35|nr:DUF4376 domain-containing protein [Pseudomonas nitroreducens]NNN24397.1 DUF4376 domain-containing protein [Pseudomonas nitroreducens]
MLYSAQRNGFFTPEINGTDIPDDAVELADEEYEALMVGLGQRKCLVPGPAGRPILQDLPLPDPAAAIAARRYDAETAGITVNGMSLDTGRDSQALVTGAALQAVIDSNYRCQWKTDNGFIDLDASQVIAIASTMRAHVQACFDREAELLVALKDGLFVETMLEEGWPQ